MSSGYIPDPTLPRRRSPAPDWATSCWVARNLRIPGGLLRSLDAPFIRVGTTNQAKRYWHVPTLKRVLAERGITDPTEIKS